MARGKYRDLERCCPSDERNKAGIVWPRNGHRQKNRSEKLPGLAATRGGTFARKRGSHKTKKHRKERKPLWKKRPIPEGGEGTPSKRNGKGQAEK